MAKQKRCSKCKTVKSVDDFGPNRAQYDGLRGYCKDCHANNTHPRSTHPKRCSECNKTKPADEFHTNAKSYDGLQSYCRSCTSIRNRLHAKALTPEQRRRYRLKAIYGITPEEYDVLVGDQKGQCSICQKQTDLVIDHCHTEGHVRGLLCNRCNIGLGVFKDNLIFFERIVEYLQKR